MGMESGEVHDVCVDVRRWLMMLMVDHGARVLGNGLPPPPSPHGLTINVHPTTISLALWYVSMVVICVVVSLDWDFLDGMNIDPIWRKVMRPECRWHCLHIIGCITGHILLARLTNASAWVWTVWLCSRQRFANQARTRAALYDSVCRGHALQWQVHSHQF